MRILVRDRDLQRFRGELEAGLAGHEVRWADPAGSGGLTGVDVFVGPRFTRDDAASADVLRLVQVAGAGLDGIDLAAVPGRAACANLFRHEASIAEYVATAAAFLRRGIGAQDAALRTDTWLRPSGGNDRPLPSGLASARIGLVGFGHIGRSCWTLFRAFGARTGCAVSRAGAAGRDTAGLAWWGELNDVDRLCRESDVVVVSLPDADRTRALIGAAQLGLVGPDGVLVNVGRGPVVEPQALYDALSGRTLGAAAIDVWYHYPAGDEPCRPADQDFGRLDNVLMTPHSSGVTRETYRARIADIVDNVARVGAGRAPRNEVRAPALRQPGPDDR